jgi:hypothetical protein
MFPGIPFNEFPLSTSEEMTETYNGDDVEYVIYIDQALYREIFIDQEKPIDVYIDQQSDFTLEN